MISEKMTEALNEQVNREMYSAYLYMVMSAHCNQVGLKGFANWFMVQTPLSLIRGSCFKRS